MAKSFDVSKFRKDLTKSITGMSSGFNDPTDWISTGSYALNYLIDQILRQKQFHYQKLSQLKYRNGVYHL